jgi:hypothetical protein
VTCGAGATCDYSACNAGFLDLDGDRTNGCETMTPLGTPEAKNGQLLLWLKADTGYGGGTWLDQSGKGANGTCSGSACPSVTDDGNGHKSLYFDGSTKAIQLTNPAHQYDSFNPTIFALATPLGISASGSTLLRFSDSGSTSQVLLVRDGTNQNMEFLMYNVSGAHYVIENNAWAGDQGIVGASIDVTGLADLWWYTQGSLLNGQVAQFGMPDTVVRSDNWVGYSPLNGGHFTGYVGEIVVFTGSVTQATSNAMRSYISLHYGGT